MKFSSPRIFAAAAFFLCGQNAIAGETEDFLTSLDASIAHYREAATYLRTGNIDLAALELESMAESWKNLRTRFGETPPDAFDGNALYAPTLQETGDDIDAALTAIDDGKEQDAAVRLAPIALKISALRRASGFYRLGDCLLDASAAMDALFVFKTTPPDLAKAEIGADVIGKAAVYRAALRRCDTMAPGKIREEPEFRRLVDGADASLARVPEAVVTADGGLLYRLLIELKSFDRLLFFRFG